MKNKLVISAVMFAALSLTGTNMAIADQDNDTKATPPSTIEFCEDLVQYSVPSPSEPLNPINTCGRSGGTTGEPLPDVNGQPGSVFQM